MQAVSIAIIVVVLNGLLYLGPFYQALGAGAVLSISGLANIAAAAISVWLGFRLWQSSRRGESMRLIWGSLTGGLILWVLAEIIWDAYQVAQNLEKPSASPADIAWILGYIAIFVGLIVRIRSLHMRITKPWQYSVLAAFGLLAVLVVIYVMIPIFNATHGAASYVGFSGLFYAGCDLVLAFLSLLLVLVLQGGLLSKPWAAIAGACFCIAVSNLLYAFALAHGIFQVGPAAGLDLISYVIDMSYTLAYVLMALGLYLQANMLDAI